MLVISGRSIISADIQHFLNQYCLTDKIQMFLYSTSDTHPPSVCGPRNGNINSKYLQIVYKFNT